MKSRKESSYSGNTLEDRRKLLRERNNTKHNFRSLKKRKIKYTTERQYYQWTGIKRDLLVRSAEDGTRWRTIIQEAVNPLIKVKTRQLHRTASIKEAKPLLPGVWWWMKKCQPDHCTDGWVTERTTVLQKNTLHYSPEVLFWTAWRRTGGKSG